MADKADIDICSVARTAEIIGDRWTLLILREAFAGFGKFDDFRSILGIARGVLTDRLNKLVDHFILTKVLYQQSPPRYEYQLTPKGRAIYPVFRAMGAWGDTFLAGKAGRPAVHVHDVCGHIHDPVLICSECGEPVTDRNTHVYDGPGVGPRRYATLPPNIPLAGSVADPQARRRSRAA